MRSRVMVTRVQSNLRRALPIGNMLPIDFGSQRGGE
jgi:hypothetical protein